MLGFHALGEAALGELLDGEAPVVFPDVDQALVLDDTFTGAAGSLGAHTADSGATWDDLVANTDVWGPDVALLTSAASCQLTGDGMLRADVDLGDGSLGGAAHASPTVDGNACGIEVVINFPASGFAVATLFIDPDPEDATGPGTILSMNPGAITAVVGGEPSVSIPGGYTGETKIRADFFNGFARLLVDDVEIKAGTYAGTPPSGKLCMVVTSDSGTDEILSRVSAYSLTEATDDITVSGWMAANFGTPILPNDVDGWRAVQFGQPRLVFDPQVFGRRHVRFGAPSIPHKKIVFPRTLRPVHFGLLVSTTRSRPVNRVRLRVYRLRPARFGTPTL